MNMLLLSVLAAAAPSTAVLTPPSGVLEQQAQACRELPTHADQLGPAKLLRRLDQLPKGHLEHAVMRTVFGCPVAEIVLDGQIYYVPSIVRPALLDPAVGNRLERPGAGREARPPSK